MKLLKLAHFELTSALRLLKTTLVGCGWIWVYHLVLKLP